MVLNNKTLLKCTGSKGHYFATPMVILCFAATKSADRERCESETTSNKPATLTTSAPGPLPGQNKLLLVAHRMKGIPQLEPQHSQLPV